jgi:hypothetical protein
VVDPKELLGRVANETDADDRDVREHRLRTAAEGAKQDRLRADRQRKAAVRDAQDLQHALEVALDVQSRQDELVVQPRERTSGIHEATAVLLYSDLHPEEVVTPDTVSNLNEFNLEIAQQRNDDLIVGARWMLDTVRARGDHPGFVVRDVVLAMLGDVISNTIHPELAESNSLLPADAILFVQQMCQDVIDGLLADEEIAQIYIPCCHGNHDRLTPRIRHQTKAGNSLAWILYHTLAGHYADEPRVRFDIARGNMVYSEIYDHTIRWTHGDDIRYHGGVGGLTIPMRKAIDSWNQSRPAALTCCGHWHQFIDHRDFVVNGSLIGYTAYAQAIKARWEPAAQAFFLLDRDRGKRIASPILLQDGAW